MFKKVLIGTTILLLFIIIAEALYLFFFKTKPQKNASAIATSTQSSSPASPASSSYQETEQDTLKINKILGIYISSAGPMFADGEIRTRLTGYVVKPPQVDENSITFDMNTDAAGNENSTIKAYFENTKFMNDTMEQIDHRTIKQGDQMSVVYIYNYKLDQYFTEVIAKSK